MYRLGDNFATLPDKQIERTDLTIGMKVEIKSARSHSGRRTLATNLLKNKI